MFLSPRNRRSRPVTRAPLPFLAFLAGGILTALLLFLVMHGLIAGGRAAQSAGGAGQILDLIRVREDEAVRTKQRVRPAKPPPPKEPPPPPKLNLAQESKPQRQLLQVRMPKIALPASGGGGPYLGKWSPGDAAAEGEAVPIVRIDPQWPREALEEGTEGFVRLEVLIGTDGSTKDVRVLESEPGRLFVRNAVRAVRRWKFKPRIVDGTPIERWAVTTIAFSLER